MSLGLTNTAGWVESGSQDPTIRWGIESETVGFLNTAKWEFANHPLCVFLGGPNIDLCMRVCAICMGHIQHIATTQTLQFDNFETWRSFMEVSGSSIESPRTTIHLLKAQEKHGTCFQ